MRLSKKRMLYLSFSLLLATTLLSSPVVAIVGCVFLGNQCSEELYVCTKSGCPAIVSVYYCDQWGYIYQLTGRCCTCT
jgi:hypothetical protein